MKRMKNLMRLLAALLIAVMILTTAAFAEELTDENFEPMDEMITAEMAGEEETFEAVAEEETFEAEETLAAEETFAAAEDEPEAIADMEEVVEEIAEPEAAEAENAEAMEEVVEEAVEFDENTGQPEDAEEAEEAGEPEVAENMDLMAAFDEADMPEITEEAEEVDRTEMMENLINEAMDARQDEGINAALDNTFATLAQNAAELSNPETGVIEVSGNEIVNLTFGALNARFDNAPEQLMGAIGAAAFRADERGELQLLGGDPVLISMAAEESGKKFGNDAINYTKTSITAILDSLGLIDPELKALIPFFKALVSIGFTTENDFNANVLKKLDDIEAEIQTAEESIKRNAYNVVSLQSIGDKYSTVADKAEQIEEKISNIVGNNSLTDAQKLQMIADLTENSEFQALESAMNGATKCFTSNVNDIFQRQSIFEAAFARASETVMFSGEALKISKPYILRQFAVYLAAYGVMNQVYNAHEEVYGASSLTATRNKMLERLGGTNMDGNSMGGTVGAQIKAYFGRSKYDCVDRGRANVHLKRGIIVARIHKDTRYDIHNIVESWARAMPLNQAQVESINGYAAARGMSLFDFLFNSMGFVPVRSPSIDVDSLFPENDPGQWFTINASAKSGIKVKLTPENATPCNRILGRWYPNTKWTYMVNGQQAFGLYKDSYHRYIFCNALRALIVGVEREEREFLYHENTYLEKWIGNADTDLMIFQG